MKVEIRNDSVVLDGYVNVPARDSRVLPSPRGRFVEQIMPKVFERALGRTENVDLLFNHKNDRKLGSIQDGNLQIYEDAVGLRAICTVNDPEVMEKAKNNELRGWSFGFICREDRWEDGEIQKRFVEDLDLLEVSILDCTPAYIATSIEARGEEMIITEQRFQEVEMKVEDNSSVTVVTTVETPKGDGFEKVVERVEETPNYSYYEKSIEIFKLKGGLY